MVPSFSVMCAAKIDYCTVHDLEPLCYLFRFPQSKWYFHIKMKFSPALPTKVIHEAAVGWSRWSCHNSLLTPISFERASFLTSFWGWIIEVPRSKNMLRQANRPAPWGTSLRSASKIHWETPGLQPTNPSIFHRLSWYNHESSLPGRCFSFPCGRLALASLSVAAVKIAVASLWYCLALPPPSLVHFSSYLIG
jgi:hypothetical protein